jgi:hypothetical protein
MSPQKRSLLKKIENLPAAKVSEVEDFVDFLAAREGARKLTKAAQEASAPSLARIWDNPENDAYDAL